MKSSESSGVPVTLVGDRIYWPGEKIPLPPNADNANTVSVNMPILSQVRSVKNVQGTIG